VGPRAGFLVINVCNHGKHYETPCIVLKLLVPNLSTLSYSKYEICSKYVRDSGVMNSEGRNKQTHDKINTFRSEYKMCKLFNPDPSY
jgi:hypothetical protein